MLLGSFGEDGPGSSGGFDFIDPSNTPGGPIQRWIQAASHTGAGWRELSPIALSLQIAAPARRCGPRSRRSWRTGPRCRPLRPSAIPAVPLPAGGSLPPDSDGGRQGSSGRAACLPWPSGTRSWATRARGRPPQRDGGSGEDRVRPCRWVGLPRRIPFRAADPEAGPGPEWTGCSSGHEGGRGDGHGLAVTLLRAGLTGRSCGPTQLPAIVRLGGFSVAAT